MKAIDVHDLSKIYKGGIKAIDHLSFKVNEGDIFGFLDTNGAENPRPSKYFKLERTSKTFKKGCSIPDT